tara:strand:+ start:4127 stop:5680 length:1554 start_codon:yes stop_codon:yes gene_type:complete
MFQSLINLTIASHQKRIMSFLGIDNTVFNIMVLNMLFTLCIGYLSALYKPNTLTNMFKCKENIAIETCCRSTNTVELEGFIYRKSKWDSFTEFSNKFKALLFYISRLEYKTFDIRSIKELLHGDINIDDELLNDTSTNVNRSQYIINQIGQFKLTDKISAYIDKTEVESKGDHRSSSGEITKYTLIIYSKHASLQNIEDFILTCENEWDKQKITDKQYFLTIKSTKNRKITWNKFLYNSNRTFDNMYIDNKQHILDKVDFFINNKDYYIKKGIPYTLGLLLYGDPGTGKTSFIKALTNKLKRHIIEISLKKITTCGQLYEAFYMESHDNLNLEFKNKLIVLEDIDAMSEIIKNRVTAKIKNPSSKEDSTDDEDSELIDLTKPQDNDYLLKNLISSMNDKNRKGCDFINSKVKDITLSFILNLFEGVLEMDGRIIIMTTNHINKIDPALIRPGRIDEKIHFKLLNSDNINNMIQFYIPEWKPIKLNNILLSQAEVMNIIISNNDNIEKIRYYLTTNYY